MRQGVLHELARSNPRNGLFVKLGEALGTGVGFNLQTIQKTFTVAAEERLEDAGPRMMTTLMGSVIPSLFKGGVELKGEEYARELTVNVVGEIMCDMVPAEVRRSIIAQNFIIRIYVNLFIESSLQNFNISPDRANLLRTIKDVIDSTEA